MAATSGMTERRNASHRRAREEWERRQALNAGRRRQHEPRAGWLSQSFKRAIISTPGTDTLRCISTFDEASPRLR
jgi:hypothetical protein